MSPERKMELLKKHKDFLSCNAEEGYKEYKTAAYINKVLADLGYTIYTDIAQTGILAILQGAEGSECILFRADMDALMSNDGTYKHLCGHDAHMAILLTVVRK